ncbi:CRAL-TRIO lipid binding domain containing protein [Parasponia andersonii]|uniref:CRAL-TRIO lipid binding domain containing protein n=1 Tax=Parasponia andersonii TaxID=3476 RepID=A0A2P5A933_PARAD|nr:CRAL-TRIO lipid binding domain containing protein [Parasponia andersonii]
MTEETQKPAAEAGAPSTEEVTVVPDVPPVEKPVTEKDASPAPVPEPEPEPEVAKKHAAATTGEVVEEAEKPKPAEEEKTIAQSVSFKEESYVVGELPESQKKALDELKQLVQEALNKHEFTAPPPPLKEKEKKEEVEEAPKAEEKEVEEKGEEKTEVKTEEKAIEETPKAEPEKEKAPEPAEAAETVVVAEVVEKVAAVDEDGAKTVEAIEESVVPVSAPAEEATSSAKTEGEAVAPAATEEPKKEEEAAAAEDAAPPPPPEEVFIWGIPLLADERSDVILLKFLRARDYKVKDAFTMLKNTVKWRKEYGIDSLIEEDLGSDWEKVVFTHGVDKEGHPVCYNVFSEFQNKELYQNTFADEEKRSKFIKWRIQFLEKSIRKLDFNPTGISTIVQVNDLKNSPGFFLNKELITGQAIQLLQDNYPEFVAKQVFINVPWWYLPFIRLISPFLTQRTKSKFVYAGPSKSTETLFKYIAPEQVPVQHGGLSRDGEEFTTSDPVTEVTVKPASKHTIEIPVSETSVLVWELRVLGWDVSYGAEFVPTAEDHYTVIVQKARKVSPTDEPVTSNSFKVGEPGKIALTIDNQSSKKKKLLYRSKTKTSSE